MRTSRSWGDAALTLAPWLQRTVAAVVCLIAVAAVVSHAAEYSDRDRFGKDFALEYASARAILNNGNPYAPMRDLVQDTFNLPREEVDARIVPGRNWHPPFKFVLILGLAALPFQLAGVIWLVLSAVAVTAAGFLVGRGAGFSGRASMAIGLAFVAVPVMQKDLSFGQVNGVLLLLLAVCWSYLKQQRDAWAGVALGVAVAIKVFPGVLLLPLLLWRRMQAVGVAVATAAGLTIVGALIVGLVNVRLISEAGREGFSYWNAAPTNISLWGAINKWLSPNAWSPNANTGWVGALLTVTLVTVLLVLMVRRSLVSKLDSYWAWVLATIVIWPIVWDHYLVLVLPWIIFEWRRISPDSAKGLLYFGLPALVLVLGVPPGAAPLTEPVPVWQSILVYQLPTYALIAAMLRELGVGQPVRSGTRKAS